MFHHITICRILSVSILTGMVFLYSCTGDDAGPHVIEKTVRTEMDSLPPPDSIGRIPADIVGRIEPADGFDFPVGWPDAKRYFKARGFLPGNIEHLGEDWNGEGGGNTDLQDFVHAVADGIVWDATDYKGGWGIVIRMLHNYGTEKEPRFMESVYAHVASTWVKPGNKMKRGEIIGTIGTASGKYHAHLHFEMRSMPGKDITCGYKGDTAGFIDPTPFIEAHRPLK